MADQWKRNLGATVDVRLADPDLYYYALDLLQFNLYDFGWIADYPDAHNFLDVLFHGDAANNKGGYKNAAVDGLLDEAAVETDPAVRTRKYQEAEKLIVEDAAAIPLYFGTNYMLVKPNIQGLVLTPFGMLDLRNLEIKQ
jgi:ABC-type oligopeptide transport system substrate-binding subunit